MQQTGLLFQTYFRQTHFKINLLVLTCKLYFVEGSVQKRCYLTSIFCPREKDTNPHHYRQGFLEAQPQSRVQGVDPQL